ncbi:MAG: hypothetical protein GXO79_07920 [Chlorobi bacterium]|nr:hypothetical protein [Chlorobiota bacterium]
MNKSENELDKILSKLNSIENRLKIVENKVGVQTAQLDSFPEKESSILPDDDIQEDTLSESNIGEKGLAFLGSVVLLFGIIFLMTFMQNEGHSYASIIIGYVSASIVFYLAHRLKKNFENMNYLFNISSLFLLYFTTLRLHFFSSVPLINNIFLEVFLLLIVFGILLYFSFRIKSQLIGTSTLLLIILTALFIDKANITLSLFVLSTICSVYLFYKYGWYKLLFAILFTVYFAHTLWLFGNPVTGHGFQQIALPQNNLIYLFCYVAVFSLMALVPQKKVLHDRIYLITLLFNGIIFSIVLIIDVFMFYQDSYANIFLIIAIVCLLYSIILFYKKERPFAPSLYACYGFMTLSIAFFGYLNLPKIYYMLALQSLLVVSIALWFRSKIIVVVNTILFLSILFIYMISSEPIGSINLAFAFVAIASARVMNWQKERLTLKTDFIRNLYLIAAFVSVLYGLYHAVPAKYISLSWTIAALIYFVLSIVLKNKKYRWMAIATFLSTVIYLFIVDLAKMGVGFRIVAFLFVAIILLGVSLYYTKKLKSKSNEKSELKE